jgi:hypothetical protein
MKRNKAIDFLTVTLFFGIILSFMIYLGLGTFVEYGIADKTDEVESFNEVFCEDETLDRFVKMFDYKVFGHASDPDLIIGKSGWLFEANDSKSGYERLLDYIGGCPFSEQELSAIHNWILDDKESYAAAGMDYMVVVIPDAMNICSDKVPAYLGRRSENARLSVLSAYLEQMGEISYLDPTASMIEGSIEMPMYNNTENSINAYGAFTIYSSAVDRYNIITGDDAQKIEREDVEFFIRSTDGKSIAARAGLDKTVKNRTVSLTDRMEYNYKVISNEKGMTVTRMNDTESGARLVIECADDWDKAQLMPYFSNTFFEVCYTTSSSMTAEALEISPATVIRLIHESQLGDLIE